MPLAFGTIAARTWDPNGAEDDVVSRFSSRALANSACP
jgi:hypothetical protein